MCLTHTCLPCSNVGSLHLRLHWSSAPATGVLLQVGWKGVQIGSQV